MTDLELLKRYAESHSEPAFAELVGRHLDWVYWAAIRQVHDRQLAEDVAQAVFIALARQARSLRRDQPLSPWLLRVTRCAAISALRAGSRRQRHEQKAAAMRPECITADPEAQWEQVAPLLDEQVLRLEKKDKEAILLRFYERKSMAEVGEVMGLSEEAAKKRVQWAVERLRGAMVGKGMTISAGALTVMVGAKVTMAAPAGFASSVVATAMAGNGAGVAGVIATGAIKMMAWARAKVIALLATLAMAAGSAAVVVGQAQGRPATAPSAAQGSTQPLATRPAAPAEAALLRKLQEMRAATIAAIPAGRGTAILENRVVKRSAASSDSMPPHEVQFLFSGTTAMVKGGPAYNETTVLVRDGRRMRYYAGSPTYPAPAALSIQRQEGPILYNPYLPA